MELIPSETLNFRRSLSWKLLSGCFIKAVHLEHVPKIEKKNDVQRVLYPLTVLAAPSTDRQTLNFPLNKNKNPVSRCLGTQ